MNQLQRLTHRRTRSSVDLDSQFNSTTKATVIKTTQETIHCQRKSPVPTMLRAASNMYYNKVFVVETLDTEFTAERGLLNFGKHITDRRHNSELKRNSLFSIPEGNTTILQQSKTFKKLPKAPLTIKPRIQRLDLHKRLTVNMKQPLNSARTSTRCKMKKTIRPSSNKKC